MVGIKSHLNTLGELLKSDKGSNDSNDHETANNKQGSQTFSNRNQEGDQNYGGNLNSENSDYRQNQGGYNRQSDTSNNSGIDRTSGRGDDNVGNLYQGRGNNPAAEAARYGDSGNLSSQSQAGYGLAGLSEGRGPSDNFGARGGVSSGGVEYGDSTDSGGYGTNPQGDSFSKKNQSGFDNDNQFSPSSGY